MTTRHHHLQIKRVYDSADASDGKRFLVERLWPRGIKKEDLAIDAWLKEIAPSAELRKWYEHEVAKWPEFQRRYRAELEQEKDELKPLLDAVKHGPVTLLYSAKDTEHNSALVLEAYLREAQ